MGRHNPPAEYFIEIYGAHVHLATDTAQWRQLMKRFSDSLNEDQTDSQGATVLLPDPLDDRSPHLAVWIDVAGHGHDRTRVLTTVAHESTHLAGMLLDHVGQAYDGQSEALAYLVGWATQWIWATVEAKL